MLATLVTYRRFLLPLTAIFMLSCAGRGGKPVNAGPGRRESAGHDKTTEALRSRGTDNAITRENNRAGGAAPKGLRADVAPGGNFDLSRWELQEPVGAPGSPTTISSAALLGPSGFQDDYFFTDKADGAMTFWDPENGVTTANTRFPRSELRELNADGTKANWPVTGAHRLSATVSVTQVPDHVCVGQIHCGKALQSGLAASTKPLLELYYYSNGDLKLGIENSPSGGQTSHYITNVTLGTKFDYVIELMGDGTITLDLNGKKYTFTMPSSFAGYGEYFKAGNYDQSVGNDPTIGAIVRFYALKVTHRL